MRWAQGCGEEGQAAGELIFFAERGWARRRQRMQVAENEAGERAPFRNFYDLTHYFAQISNFKHLTSRPLPLETPHRAAGGAGACACVRVHPGNANLSGSNWKMSFTAQKFVAKSGRCIDSPTEQNALVNM